MEEKLNAAKLTIIELVNNLVEKGEHRKLYWMFRNLEYIYRIEKDDLIILINEILDLLELDDKIDYEK